VVVADRVHVLEKDRAVDVQPVVGISIAAIDDSDVRIFQVSGEPLGGDDGLNRRGGSGEGEQVQHGALDGRQNWMVPGILGFEDLRI
jgi:hypothetical protein